MKRDNSDNSWNDEITCPYCGYEFSDSWESDDSGDFDCYECDKTFSYERHIVASYSTTRDCAGNDEEHEWKFKWHNEERKSDTYECTKCDALDFRESKQEMLNLAPDSA